MKKMIAFIGCCLIIFCSCHTYLKQTTNENDELSSKLPDWAITKPTDTYYYYGLGVAHITSGNTDHIQAAREQALKDLSGEIQTAITGTSFLMRYETDLRLSSNFLSTVKAETNVALEGYELVHQAQHATNYYVLYRLSKLDYHAKHKQKKDNILSMASTYLQTGDKAVEQGHIGEAMRAYIQGLNLLHPYYAESMQYPTEDGFEDLGALFLEQILQQVSAVQWQFSSPVIQTTEQSYEAYFYSNTNNLHCQGLKVAVKTSDTLQVISDEFTDVNGKLRIQVKSKHATVPGTQLLLVIAPLHQVNKNDINPVLTELLARIEKKAIWPISITPPTFYIKADERILGKPASYASATYATQGFLEEQKAPIVDAAYLADYILHLEANTEKSTTTGGVFVAYANISIKISSQKTKLPIFSTKIENVKGVGLDYISASRKAYAEARKLIRKALQRFWDGEKN